MASQSQDNWHEIRPTFAEMCAMDDAAREFDELLKRSIGTGAISTHPAGYERVYDYPPVIGDESAPDEQPDKD